MSPGDGQLYLAGFQIWQSQAKDVSSLVRLRYTGRPSTLPVEGHFKRDGSAGHDRLNVAAHLSPDGRSVLLVVPDMKPAMQMQLDYDLRGRDGAARKSALYLTVHAVDPSETATVLRVPMALLADPRNRFQVRHPSGYVGPAFAVAGLVVWGFTGGLLSALLHLGGWERPWDSGEVRDLDEAWAAVRTDGREVAET